MFTEFQTKYYSIKEISDKTGVSSRTLQDRCDKNRYKTRKITSAGGKNGKKYEILFSSLEPELQAKLIEDNSSERSLVPISPINKAVAVPPKARMLALAKADIVNAWCAYRSDKADKTKANEEFVTSYNSGNISQSIFSILGNVSIRSIQRWKKQLDSAEGNAEALIQNYNYTGKADLNTTLSDVEKQEITKIYFNDSKMNLAKAYKIIEYLHKQKGLETKSLSTYRRFIEYVKTNHNDVIVLAREGEKALKDNVAPYLRRDISMLEVGDCLVADGNKLDFMVKSPISGKPTRAIWVVFLDWKSFDVVGSELMLTENTQSISSALRNSIIRLGKIPKYVYMDNGRAFKGKYFTSTESFGTCGFYGIYSSLGINLQIAKAYNGRAKVVERFFQEFVQSLPPCVSSYIGNSIANKPAHLNRNENFHKELHKNDKVPTIQEAKEIIENWLEFYRSSICPHNKEGEKKTIGEVFNEGVGSGVDIDLLDELMMATETRTARRNTIKLFGMEYTSAALYGKTGKFIIKYSLFDISQIKIYSQKGEYIGEAKTVIRVNPLAKYLGNKKDLYTYRQQQKQINELIKNTKKRTRMLMSGSPFEELPYNDLIENKQPDVINIESKKPKLEITMYEDIHKFKQSKLKI